MWFSSTANVRVRLPSSVKAMSSFCPESATRFHTPKRVSLLIDTVSGGPLSTTLKSQVSHKFRRKTVVGKWDRVACTFQWMLRNSSAALSKSSNVSWLLQETSGYAGVSAIEKFARPNVAQGRRKATCCSRKVARLCNARRG